MECPKCHSTINVNETTCPKCNKVLLLECPNCHSFNESSTCEKCGYPILIKCAKCSKIIPSNIENCSKCKFPTQISIANQECETDEFASVVIKFEALETIKQSFHSQEQYSNFYYRLKNILSAQLKGVECKHIFFNNVIVINFCKELSLATSSNKAIRFAIKLANAYTDLNLNLIEDFSTPLKLSISIIKKDSKEILLLPEIPNSINFLTKKSTKNKYLSGMNIILDQYIWDYINKDYKTDSLYSVEKNGKLIMFYTLLLEQYISTPNIKNEIKPTQALNCEIQTETPPEAQDIYSFKVFDINAKCSFIQTNAYDFWEKFSNTNIEKNGKIVSIRTNLENSISITKLKNLFDNKGYKIIRTHCSEELQYKPWGLFIEIFKEYFNLSFHNELNNLTKIDEQLQKKFKTLFNLVFNKPSKTLTPEDARYTFMEGWAKFLKTLKNTVIIIENFENIDDTSIQTLELYFEKFKNIIPNFVFITNQDNPVQGKIKQLLRTNLYTEFSITNVTSETCLTSLNADATDFIQSIYYEKFKEYFNGSYLYFINLLEYLKEKGILSYYQNKLIINNKKDINDIPNDLNGLIKERLKHYNKNSDISLILAYSVLLSHRLDRELLKKLGIKNLDKNLKILSDNNLISTTEHTIYIENYDLIKPIATELLNSNAEKFLVKNIIANIGKGLDDYILAILMGRIKVFKEEYLTLWKNSQYALKTGDYDCYLKNCLGYLSLVEHIPTKISNEEIENNKKEVYTNLLQYLYSYSPEKIYSIANILLSDAIKKEDDNKITKLSNLMLQGALISANYTNSEELITNITDRMDNSQLETNGVTNKKYLLLSLVKIEVLYNIGKYQECIDLVKSIIKLINFSNIDSIKPETFSKDLFLTHLTDTFRLGAFAKLYLLEDDLDNFFDDVKLSLGIEHPEKDCILAIKDYLQGKTYSIGNVEEYSAFSKVVLLLLQELSTLKNDYKRFAQNIYQAKLLALELNQKELEFVCDLLIGFAYSKLGITEKALAIYNDIITVSEKTSIFSPQILANYLKANLLEKFAPEESLNLIEASLLQIKKYNNQQSIFSALYGKTLIKMVEQEDAENIIDIKQTLENMADKLAFLKEFSNKKHSNFEE